VTWTIEVRNDGDTSLREVDVDDDQCSAPLVGPSGPGSETGVLEPGDTWVYTCTEALSEDTTNVASVEAEAFYLFNGQEITDEDPVVSEDTAVVDVTATPTTPAPTAPPAPPAGLSSTGADLTPGSIGLGLLLMGSTALLISMRRRSARSDH
jgi:hypothetical protein